MSKQLKLEQWLELFNIYETFGMQAMWSKYRTYRKIIKTLSIYVSKNTTYFCAKIEIWRN